MASISQVGKAANPIDKKNPIKNRSLKPINDLLISLDFLWDAKYIPASKAPKSPLILTNSNSSYAPKAKKNPAKGISSPWPIWSTILLTSGFSTTADNNRSAHREGILPVAITRNKTAAISCITSIPMASLPCRVRISP